MGQRKTTETGLERNRELTRKACAMSLGKKAKDAI